MQNKIKKLNFGCGEDIKKGWDNIDIQKSEKIYKSFDFDEYPYPIKNNTYDYILLKQVIEHLTRPKKTLEELHRIGKPGSIICIETCYYNNKGAFNDMEHMHYFSEQTFKHFVENTSEINKKKKFEIIKIKLAPTKVGKFIPRRLREKMSLFIGGLIGKIYVELKVIK
jgi:SAM-dependent methyltransferase